MKARVFIQQILSTEIDIDIPNHISEQEREQYIRDNINTPIYAMDYYDRQVSKTPIFKDWTLDNEVIMPVDIKNETEYNYSQDDGYND